MTGRRCKTTLIPAPFFILTSSRSSHRTPEYESGSSASTTQSSCKSELGSESSEVPQEVWHETFPITPTSEPYLPLERYCYHLEPHEQLALGQITDRGSPTQLIELDKSLYATARVLPGCTSRSSAPSPSSSSSPGSEEDDVPYTFETDPLFKDSTEPQAALLEEQAKHLHKIAKLRRRLRAEGKGRMKKPARVRKRIRLSEKSTETGQGGARSFE
ncbi:hypothetical protein NPX13_g7380 [Xylaria arbuscula]|uniref:Uncharacterized protein n=1 Tax=Xylaria arbuscula TaxID=114810 RepID=A0A9W8TKH3_9PEZI|nr:hypothetical protein NPX13_g7380 [Xylaria arbuscula]